MPENLETIIKNYNDIDDKNISGNNINTSSTNPKFKPSIVVKGLGAISSLFPPESKLKEEYKNKKITHYFRTAMDYSLGILIKAQVGAAPGSILEDMAQELEEKYAIKETPQKYCAYSIGIGLLNNAMFFLAAYGLIKLPNISIIPFADEVAQVLGYAKLAVVSYSTFIEIPIRSWFLIKKKQAIGILPLEGLYRLLFKKDKYKDK